MAGTVLADTLQSSITGTPVQFNDGTGTQIGTLCRAWVNFNGTGTVAIRASFNVTSITDNGTGDYTVNFTTAMPDANYSTVTSSNQMLTRTPVNDATTTSVTIITGRPADFNGNQTSVDASNVNVAILR